MDNSKDTVGTPDGACRQGLNAFRLIGIGLVVLVLLFAALDGLSRTVGTARPGEQAIQYLIGFGELLVVGAVLWLTQVWSRWVAAVALFGALKAFIGVITGTTLSPPFRSFPRLLSAEVVAYLLISGLLSIRFVSHPPRAHEKIALILLVFVICADMLFEPSHVALAIGVGSLVLARLASVASDRSAARGNTSGCPYRGDK